jgi:putative thioredoxin
MTVAVPPVLDVSDKDFDTVVVERSRATPVVVDFWAPWCGPCRVLGPILERLATEMQGAFVLAKVNVDQSPELSRRFDVRGIPMVKAFVDGQMADGFTGALPESQVRTWLRKLIPSDADRLAEEAARLAGTDPHAAADRYRAALEQDPQHSVSLAGLGRLLVLTGDPEADEFLRRVPAGNRAYAEAHSLLALNDFLRTPEAGAAAEPEQQDDRRYVQAAAVGRQGKWEEALEQLLEIIQQKGVAGDGSPGGRARRAMLAIFSLIGESDPLVVRYRRLLANALF